MTKHTLKILAVFTYFNIMQEKVNENYSDCFGQ